MGRGIRQHQQSRIYDPAPFRASILALHLYEPRVGMTEWVEFVRAVEIMLLEARKPQL
jgi:hypothetical protein